MVYKTIDQNFTKDDFLLYAKGVSDACYTLRRVAHKIGDVATNFAGKLMTVRVERAINEREEGAIVRLCKSGNTVQMHVFLLKREVSLTKRNAYIDDLLPEQLCFDLAPDGRIDAVKMRESAGYFESKCIEIDARYTDAANNWDLYLSIRQNLDATIRLAAARLNSLFVSDTATTADGRERMIYKTKHF